MAILDFLTVINNPSNPPFLNDLFGQFQSRTGHTIQGNMVGWSTLWRECTNAGIYNKGADLAEIGSTWLEGLVAMQALRSFQPHELNHLGGVQSFVGGSWSAVTVGGDDRVWGIPIRSDVRVLWYWKDMLEDAGLDPETAFSSFAQFPATFDALRSVISTPWAVTTNVVEANTLQVMSSWLWEAGGEFISPNGKQIQFMEPDARRGLTAFFDLHRYMPKDEPAIDGTHNNSMFASRKICATISGPWMLNELINRKIPSDRVGVTMIPGPSFVGGTLLVIYKNCRNVQAALDFMGFLLEKENQIAYSNLMGLLPTRHVAWEDPSLATNPFDQVLYKALSSGRAYPPVSLWGSMEQKLLTAASAVWEKLLRGDSTDVPGLVDQHFGSLARRLQVTLDG